MNSVAAAQENVPAISLGKPIMDTGLFMAVSQQAVVDNFNSHRRPERSPELTTEGVNMVWFAKAISSWKAVFMSPLARGLLWEVTFNRTKNEIYLDVYSKLNNTKISMEDVTT